MKTLLSVLVAAGIGFAAAYFIVSNQIDDLKNQRATLEAQWDSEREKLEGELAASKRKAGRVDRITTENTVIVAGGRSAEEILEKLQMLKPAAAGAPRISTIRKIVHELE